MSNTYATTQDLQPFLTLFNKWTYAFNHKQLNEACALFSRSVIADYQGFPVRHFSDICNSFQKIFNSSDYLLYKFKIHHIYRCKNLAVIRITWYLEHYQQDKLVELTQDEGIDVLQKNSLGQWQIVNYLAYQKH